MADYDLVRDVLDEQLVDARGRPIGKADGIVIEIRDGAPPRVVAIETGLPVLARRLHPALGRWVLRFNARMRIPHDGWIRLPFHGLDVRETEIEVPIDGEEAGAFGWERWVRSHVVARLPWGGA